MDVSIRVAFIELYKEQLYDLLSQRREKDKENCILDIRQASNGINIFKKHLGLVPLAIEHCPIKFLFREDPAKGVCIPGLTELEVGTLESTMKQLEKGSSNRVTAATAMNKTSSRDKIQ